jgi:hypothetical protein
MVHVLSVPGHWIQQTPGSNPGRVIGGLQSIFFSLLPPEKFNLKYYAAEYSMKQTRSGWSAPALCNGVLQQTRGSIPGRVMGRQWHCFFFALLPPGVWNDLTWDIQPQCTVERSRLVADGPRLRSLWKIISLNTAKKHRFDFGTSHKCIVHIIFSFLRCLWIEVRYSTVTFKWKQTRSGWSAPALCVEN